MSVLSVGLLHLLDDDRNGGCVDVGSPPLRDSAIDVVRVDCLEKGVDLANRRELFKYECALEIALVHSSPLSRWLAAARRLTDRLDRCNPSIARSTISSGESASLL